MSKNKFNIFRPSFVFMIIMMSLVITDSTDEILAHFFDIDLEQYETIIEEESKESEDIDEDNLDEMLYENDLEHQTIDDNTDQIGSNNYQFMLKNHIGLIVPPPECRA